MDSEREILINEFAVWLQESEGYDEQESDRKAWDFVSGAYSPGDTLADFQDAWEDCHAD